MIGARDMAEIGLPFAAGAAAGAILFSSFPSEVLLFPASMAGTLFLLTTYSFIRSGDFRWTRAIIALSFCLAGVFCSLNSRLTAGIDLPPGPVGRLCARCLAKLVNQIDSIPYPSEGTGPLVKALITGDRSGLGKETVQMFRASGASHILALSGLHLGIIYLILNKLTVPLGNSPTARKIRFIILVGSSCLYAVMTGASPSIVRALLFIIIGETGKLLLRERNPVRVLVAALTIQLALKPEVISTTGFQLSYLAMLGICTVYPRLLSLYPDPGGIRGRLDPFRNIWKAASLSISCQMSTAPLVWLRFGTFPKYFLVTNLIAMPLTSAVMVLSVTTIALSFLGICPYTLVEVNDLAVSALLDCLEIISGL